MTDIRKGDPAARRTVALALVVSACLGALLIAAFTRYRVSLEDWIRADPGGSLERARLVFIVLGGLLVAPLGAFASYLWFLGEKVVRAREFPPPGMIVIHDTAVITGERAASRGRLLKVFAVCCGVACVALAVLFWWFESLLRR